MADPREPDTVETLAARDADREAALSEVFHRHHLELVRLATLLGAESEAEDVVADAFCELHRNWRKLRSTQSALPYLRAVIVNLVRMRVRHLQVVRKHVEWVREDVDSAEAQALDRDDQRALLDALRELPARQREALVLRYWLGLKEAEIAEAMGISAGAVKAHTARGMAKLGALLEADGGH
ncbi:sigma-70 family RNA polymerase sigma factor [Saccharothrix sp. NPDC042600]|uniref:RNA polymerase sigma factor n=1 Tax=Saccharothrix TaxID=2071 RepID=UPI00340D9BFA|nr:SigE family RNA polymerase sigma factor [Saccharothrix mutabilis subsp. capreolus]